MTAYEITVWPVDGKSFVEVVHARDAKNALRIVRRLYPGCLSSSPRPVTR